MLFRSQKIKQHESFDFLIVCHFLSSLSWRDKWRVSWFNNFISRLSLATKPRPQKLANFNASMSLILFFACSITGRGGNRRRRICVGYWWWRCSHSHKVRIAETLLLKLSFCCFAYWSDCINSSVETTSMLCYCASVPIGRILPVRPSVLYGLLAEIWKGINKPKLMWMFPGQE